MAICPSCGSDIPVAANFCEYCGQKVSDRVPDFQELKDPATGPLYDVRLGKYLRTGWETFLQYPRGFIGFSLIFLLVMVVFMILEKKFRFLGFLLAPAIAPLHAGLYIVSAKLLQRQPCLFGDFFSGYHYYRPLLIFGFLMGVVTRISYFIPAQHTASSLLCTLILMIFPILYFFTPLVIIDRRLGWLPAMELSRKTVQRRPLRILGFIFLGGLILIAGAVALGVGALVTLPWFSAATTAAYADLFGLQSQEY